MPNHPDLHCALRATFAPKLILAVLGLVATSSVASAKVTPCPPWQLESDDDFSFEADYQAPPPVKGLTLQGFFAEDSISISDGEIKIAGTKECPVELTIPDPRGLSSDFPPRTMAEVWLFRTRTEGLYLRRKWSFVVGKDCKPTTRIETRVVRFSIFNGTARFIEVTDAGMPMLRTVSTGNSENSLGMPAQFLLISDADLKNRVRVDSKRHTDRRFGPSKLRIACFDDSIAFHFATLCYLDKPGPWHGLLTSSEYQDDDGGNYFEFGLTELDANASIDGRLFEWGRAITFSGGGTPKQY